MYQGRIKVQPPRCRTTECGDPAGSCSPTAPSSSPSSRTGSPTTGPGYSKPMGITLQGFCSPTPPNVWALSRRRASGIKASSSIGSPMGSARRNVTSTSSRAPSKTARRRTASSSGGTPIARPKHNGTRASSRTIFYMARAFLPISSTSTQGTSNEESKLDMGSVKMPPLDRSMREISIWAKWMDLESFTIREVL